MHPLHQDPLLAYTRALDQMVSSICAENGKIGFASTPQPVSEQLSFEIDALKAKVAARLKDNPAWAEIGFITFPFIVKVSNTSPSIEFDENPEEYFQRLLGTHTNIGNVVNEMGFVGKSVCNLTFAESVFMQLIFTELKEPGGVLHIDLAGREDVSSALNSLESYTVARTIKDVGPICYHHDLSLITPKVESNLQANDFSGWGYKNPSILAKLLGDPKLIESTKFEPGQLILIKTRGQIHRSPSSEFRAIINADLAYTAVLKDCYKYARDIREDFLQNL